MKSVICSSQTQAQKLSDDMDQALGFPWSGKNWGPGVHGPAVQTTGLAKWQKHPSQNKWAYPFVPDVDAHANGKKDVTLPTPSTIEELTPDWTPATL